MKIRSVDQATVLPALPDEFIICRISQYEICNWKEKDSKIEPIKPKEYTVTLTKTSADVSITQGNSAYSLAGATYNVYKGTSGTGSVVATFTTDEAGHATLSTPLEDGIYRKHAQVEFAGPAILFACLLFTLTAPLYIWGVVGM